MSAVDIYILVGALITNVLLATLAVMINKRCSKNCGQIHKIEKEILRILTLRKSLTESALISYFDSKGYEFKNDDVRKAIFNLLLAEDLYTIPCDCRIECENGECLLETFNSYARAAPPNHVSKLT